MFSIKNIRNYWSPIVGKILGFYSKIIPCFTNLVFWFGSVINNEITSRLDDSIATVNGYSLYFESASTSTFINDVLLYLSKVRMYVSADGNTWDWFDSSTDSNIYYSVDTANRILTIWIGTDFHSNLIELYRLKDGEHVKWLEFKVSSGYIESWNVIDESEWNEKQHPFDTLKANSIMTNDLNW